MPAPISRSYPAGVRRKQTPRITAAAYGRVRVRRAAGALLAAVTLLTGAACGSAGPQASSTARSGSAVGTSGPSGPGTSAESAGTATEPANAGADPADPTSAGADRADPSTASDPSATGEPSTSYPITIENCGFDVTVTAPPQRIVAIKSTSLEMLLALGLADRVVGAAFLDGPVPSQWAAAAQSIPIISTGAPSSEAVLNLNPDLIFAGWESNFAADTAGDRGQLAKLGVASFVSPAACQSHDQPAKLTFPQLFSEFDQIGALLGVPDKAADLVSKEQQKLAKIIPPDPGATALWWSSATDTPYVGGGIGAPEMIMAAAGLKNIAADIQQTWTSLGWEAIADADPDVIVLVDASWNSAAKKIAYLKDHAATKNLSAVLHDRFVTIPFAASEAGVRSVDAAAEIADQLRKLNLGP